MLRAIQSAELMKTRASRDGQGAPVAEGEDARVLQEPADDRFDPDVLRQAFNARPQAADAADHAHHLHAGGRGLIQLVDQRLVDQAVELEPDAGRLGGAREADLSALTRSINVVRVVSGLNAIESIWAGLA